MAMTPEERRCPDGDCEHNQGGRCMDQSVAALGLMAGASMMQGGMPFMAPFGASMAALPAMLNDERNWGMLDHCPRRREKSRRD